MFNSKNLLVAFCIGTLGLALTYLSVAELPTKFLLGPFCVGQVLIWVSALFGGFLAGVEVSKKPN